MPTYDYECQGCGHKLEVFQSITESVKKKCPKCGKSKLARLIGPGAGFLFKGGGFYLTDYRSQSYKAGEKADSAPNESAAGTADASKTEPKSGEAATSEASKPGASASASDASRSPRSSASKSASKSAPKPKDDAKSPKSTRKKSD